MLEPAGRLAAASLLLAFAIVIGTPSPAAAPNAHTVAEWNHGLGESSTLNYYVHPYNDSTYDHAHPSNKISLYNTLRGLRYDHSCTCQHSHMNFDTSTTDERKFASYHSVAAEPSIHSRNSSLNNNLHCHHTYNGPWTACYDRSSEPDGEPAVEDS